ncbi:MAG TPA: hypothetical protein VN704_10085 [Verrucomicrobiae bacterium]|nr:hypothetical protein [Verrucomicrobiae bacterium]
MLSIPTNRDAAITNIQFNMDSHHSNSSSYAGNGNSNAICIGRSLLNIIKTDNITLKKCMS